MALPVVLMVISSSSACTAEMGLFSSYPQSLPFFFLNGLRRFGNVGIGLADEANSRTAKDY